MTDQNALRQLRDRRAFGGWDEFISPERVQASEDSIRMLIDDLLALGSEFSEAAARLAVEKCVRRFNALDDGWICTTEREDICDQIGLVIDACGFDCQDDWLGERDW